MRAALLLVLFSVPAVAAAQVFPGGGGGMCTLDGTQAGIATSYRATATTGTAFQSDAVLECSFDTGPGARNCVGTNVSGDILLGPGSGSTTVVRVFGDFTGLLINGSNITASAAFILGNNAFLVNSTGTKPVLVTDADGFQINATTPIKGWVQLPVTVDFASVAAASCGTQSVTVTGATNNDGAWANADFALPLGVSIGNVRVTGANTVELTLCNVTAGALDPDSGSYIFRLSR